MAAPKNSSLLSAFSSVSTSSGEEDQPRRRRKGAQHDSVQKTITPKQYAYFKSGRWLKNSVGEIVWLRY